MIFLGVDYGFSRIGLAKSDEGGVMAFPYDTISSKKNLQTYCDDKCIMLTSRYKVKKKINNFI